MTLLLGRGGALDNNELEERRLERSLHVDEEIVGIAEKYVTVTELLGRREEEEEDGESVVPSSLQATLGVDVKEEEVEEVDQNLSPQAEEHSEIDSKASLHVGNAIVKTSNRYVEFTKRLGRSLSSGSIFRWIKKLSSCETFFSLSGVFCQLFVLRSSRKSTTPLQHSTSHSSLSRHGDTSMKRGASPAGTFKKSLNSSAAELVEIAGSSPSTPSRSVRRSSASAKRSSTSMRKVASTSSLPVREESSLSCKTPRISSSLERLTQVGFV